MPILAPEEVLLSHPADIVVEEFLDDAHVFNLGDQRILRGWLRYDGQAARARLDGALADLDVSYFLEEVEAGTRVTITHPRSPAIPPEWRKNLLFFMLTVLSTLWAGAFLEGAAWDFFLREPLRIVEGVPFSAALMGILATHEFGHYVAARRYGLNVSLPFFIPLPLLSPIGTLGAVIKMRTPIYTKRMLLDVGAAGPLAGIAVAIPIAIYGIVNSPTLPAGRSGLLLGEPLLFKAMVALFSPSMSPSEELYLNSVAFAGWIGLFVTALNMLPVGQLDGGHVLYAMFGRLQHVIGYVFFAAILVMGLWWPGWFLWAFLLLAVIRIKHPPVLDPEIGLDRRRHIVGWLAIGCLVLCFAPVPFQIG